MIYHDIADLIKMYMDQEKLNIRALSRKMEMNAGQISKALTGELVSSNLLDAFTQVAGKPKGYYYLQFINEMFRAKPHWKRLKSFIESCAKIDRLDLIKVLMERLLELNDDLKQIDAIFECAEELYHLSYSAASAVLYSTVIQIERYNQSQRFAISLFRLFQIYCSDPKQALMSVLQFMPYRSYLPESILLEALISTGHYFWLHNDADTVNQLAEELMQLSHALYENHVWKTNNLDLVQPLVYYYGQSYLMKAIYYEMIEDYQSAMNWHMEYEDLSWFEGLDEKGKIQVDRYSHFAYVNKLQMSIKLGWKEYIPEYVEFLKKNRQEIVHGLESLLASANTYHYNIDEILKEFSEYLTIEVEDLDMEEYNQAISISRLVKYNLEYAIYAFSNKTGNLGIQKLLSSMKAAIQIDEKSSLLKAISLFEMNRVYATKEQVTMYKNLCNLCRRSIDEDDQKNYVGRFGA
ncbi:hypothetical protein QCD85_06260 [Paenibacillus sp. PsM32]|uniref:hypothetical protein n=1 Tax=Paenibacillus sp. PsM32 TaxID=3030536 RepID=UPI00263B0A0E|nr:hypothetical protein [Paenibacillus sp. PsM32]MDN4617694.1 hypothetical protein [Paenibacillus sp. PsM32]